MNPALSRIFGSIATRLTLWYVGVLGLVLALLSAGVYMLVTHSQYERFDAGLRQTVELAAATLNSSHYDPTVDGRSVNELLRTLPLSRQSVAVMDVSGQTLGERTAPGSPHLRVPNTPLSPSDTIQFFDVPETQDDMDDGLRAAYQRVRTEGAKAAHWVVAWQGSESLQDQSDLLFEVLCAGVPVMLILAGTGGWLLARNSMAPGIEMARSAQRISAENLDHRLPIGDPHNEFGGLAEAFNELLARLHSAFAQQRQFMADASHDLRTPISAIRTTAEVLLEREGRHEGEYREAMTIIREQSRRLTRIVENMFTLARAEAGQAGFRATELYLDELVDEVTRGAGILASAKNLRLEARGLAEAPFCGDEEMLRQMLWNLVENAIKYTPPGGRVEVTLRREDRQYRIAVADSGEGIPEEAQAHIFERFYRADSSRSRTGGADESGAGLGLPIARSIAEAHGGTVELHESGGAGSVFEVVLPADGVESARPGAAGP